MGLFDGAADGVPEASTASIARLLDAPVILVVDVSALSTSVAAIVHGYSTLDPSITVAGVILNRVASAGHETLLRDALVPLGTKVLGAVRRDDSFTWRDRHLGLVPVAEHAAEVEQSIAVLARHVSASVDLGAILAVARAARPMVCEEPRRARHVGSARIAVAAGPAFDFVYRDNLEALIDAGAELLPFDPRNDGSLPDGVTALYAGGGFPEVFASDLARNGSLRNDLQRRFRDGLVVWAECGGLLWLARSLDGHPMADLVPTDAAMSSGLTLGYRNIELGLDCPLGRRGDVLRGHEFHYSTVTPPGDALHLTSRHGQASAGFASAQLLASYVHLHLGGDPTPAEFFVAAADGGCA
jgi:cobyrinic acid a,c-diamide synthase